jgi:two-component system OmpR family sensor kinase
LSLRARLLLGIVALVTGGLSVMAIVTYEEQRSFLYSRIDGQVRESVGPVSFALARRGELGAAIAVPKRRAQPRLPFTRPHRGALGLLPLGTFGELIGADGKLAGQPVFFHYGSTPPPTLPSHFPRSTLRRPRLFTFSTARGARYRAVAVGVPGGTLVAAVPLREEDQALGRLVLVEGLVGGGVLLALVALGWLVLQVGLRPLERIGATAAQIAHGDLSRRVSPSNDRTEVGRLGAALNEMLSQIEHAFAERGAGEERLRQFLADASHELRTPLQAILGYAELQRLGILKKPAEAARALERIESEAVRMGRIVDDLLTLARLGELPASTPDVVELAELARHVVEDVRATDRQRRIELLVSQPGTHPVHGDADQLRRVLANLLRNAVIHTPAGTPVQVSVRRREAAVLLEVRDHGPGLPEGANERVFERFWRGQTGRHRGPGGSGLGLAIVQAIVTAHHGTVRAENVPDGGARFRITLPALADRELSVNAQQTPTLTTP